MSGRGRAVRGGCPLEEIWLALETATPTGSVAVWKGGLAFEQTQRIQGVHSERMLPSIARALEAVGTTPAEVTALVVGSGPGSFTGVRIAASVAKGWVSARGTPLFAYPSLLALAAGTGVDGPVCALFDARRGEVYGACYEMRRAGYTTCVEPGAWTMEELLSMLHDAGSIPRFVGEGARLHREVIEAAFGPAAVLPEHLGLPRAASLLWLRLVAPEAGRVPDPGGWTPLYVRDWRVPEVRSE